jgi:lipopolysaccharide transport system permease protein
VTDVAAKAGPTEPPLLVIEPGSVSLRRYFRDLLHHRDLVRVLGVRDLKLRYRQTALGVVWVVLQPILAAGILSFVFGRIARLPTDGVPPFVFTFAGMLIWTSVSQTITRTTTSLITNAALVQKVFFPRLILPLSTLMSVTLDFFVSLALLVLLVFLNDISIGLPFLLTPVWVLVALLLASGIGLFLASLCVHYRDVAQMSPVLLQLLLYASPVAYSATAVPAQYGTLYHLNPFAGIIEAGRWSLLGTPLPPAWTIAYSVGFAVVAFVAGMVTLEKLEQRFADVI